MPRTHLLSLLLTLLALGSGCHAPQPFELQETTRGGELVPFLAGTGEEVFTPDKYYPLGGFGGGARREEFPFHFGMGWPGRLALMAHQWYHESGDEGRSDLLVGSKGVHDHLTAKALVLRPEGEAPLALVRIDAIGTTSELHDRVCQLVAAQGYPPERVVISATHTHSGPGAFFRAPAACLIAMDNFRPEIEEQIAQACANAILSAHASARPAELGFARARDRSPEGAPRVARNRRHRSFRDEVDVHALDDEIGLLLLKEREGGAPLALLVNYSVHPTVLGPDNLHYSADLAGAIEDALEAGLGAPALFINGAEGDIGPQRVTARGGLQRCRELGQVFAEMTLPSLVELQTEDRIRVSAALGEKDLGSAHILAALGRDRFVSGYDGISGWITSPLVLPINALLWTLGFTNVRVCLTADLALGVVGYLDGLTPRSRTRLGGIRLETASEDVAFLSLPGEGTHDVGLELKDMAKARGASRTFVLGLTFDHVGYIASEREYRRGGYEATSTLFGPTTAAQMLASQQVILEALGY